MNDKERIEYFKEQIARLSNQVVDLQNERDALAAQVERMSTFIKLSAKKREGVAEVEPTFWNLLRVANESPQQHLAEIRAEAGRAGFVAGYMSTVQFDDGYELLWANNEANQYAAKLRQGGAE